MEIHLDSRSEELIERQLRSGRYPAEQVVANALERREAVEDMLGFAEKHRLTLR